MKQRMPPRFSKIFYYSLHIKLMVCIEDIDRKGTRLSSLLLRDAHPLLRQLAALKETTIRQIHVDMDLMDDQ